MDRQHRNSGAYPRAADVLLIEALSSVASPIFITDKTGEIIWSNNAFLRLTGYSRAELAGRSPHLLKSGQQDDPYYATLWETILAGSVWQGEMVDRRKDGTLYVVDEVITPLFDGRGKITHFVAVQHELKSRDEERVRDHYLAYHDALTGLANRTHFVSELKSACENAAALSKRFAALFLDLDKFKQANDLFGHSAGDALLIAVAQRLRNGVRRGDVVARVGGDEFAILLRGSVDRRIVAALASKMATAISQPYLIDGRQVVIGASIGIAMYPGDGENSESLLRNADRAMYSAKQSGGGYRFSSA